MSLFFPRHTRRTGALRTAVESLETRKLLHASIVTPIDDVAIEPNSAPTIIDLTNRYSANTTVEFSIEYGQASAGIVDVELTDTVTPLTVANFLHYVDSGAYNGTFIHRSVKNFVVQGGGYTFGSFVNKGTPTHIPTNPPVQNEFQAGITTNIRGTIAMAKSGGLPNSATSEFFFSLADNRSNLDNQNGGFTTFGSVIGAGMDVVDGIGGQDGKKPDNLQIVDNTPNHDPNGLLYNLPVKNYPGGAVSRDNLVVINSVTRLPSFTLSVESDNNALVFPLIQNGNQLRLGYGPGKTGTANITVHITTPDGGVVNDAFAVHVSTNNQVSAVTLGGGNKRAMHFVDGDGSIVNLSLSRGTGTIIIRGENVFSTIRANRIDVSGNGLAIDTIVTDSTNGAGSLVISVVRGNGVTTANSITANQGLGSILAKNAVISGPVTVAGSVNTVSLKSTPTFTATGAVKFATFNSISAYSADSTNSLTANALTGTIQTTNSLNKITAKTVTSATLSIGGSTGKTALSLGTVTDTNLFCTLPLSSLAVLSWTGSNLSISAPSIALLTAKGAFSPTVTLSGAPKGKTLGLAKISGLLGPSAWTVSGDAGPFTAASIAPGSSLSVSGSLASFTSGAALDSFTLDASAIKLMKVTGDLSNTTITASGAFDAKSKTLGSLTVKGSIVSSTIISNGNVGTVTARGMSASRLAVGTSLFVATQPTDFNGAKISSIAIAKSSDGSPTFSNTTIAAQFITTANLGVVQTNNGGTPFTTSADEIKKITFFEGATKVSKTKLLTSLDNISTGDFLVSLV